jgi:hypothetical protein
MVSVRDSCARWLQVFRYNLLESVYLITAMLILLAGMAFQSSIMAPGSHSYKALTYIVSAAGRCICSRGGCGAAAAAAVYAVVLASHC